MGIAIILGAFVLVWLLIRIRTFGGSGRRHSRRMIRRELRRAGHGYGRHRGMGDGSGATFFRSATEVQRVPSLSPLYGRPGYVRALVRTGVAILVLILAWAAVTDWDALVLGVRTAGAVGAGTGVAVGVRRWRTRERRRRRHALFVAIGRFLELPPSEYARSGRKWITYTDSELSESGTINITVPPDFLGSANQIDGITRIINQRLPGEWECFLRLDRLQIHYEHAAAPPGRAPYRDYEEWFTGGQEHVIPIGPSARREMVTVNLQGDSPHIAIVAGSGGGKSTFLALQAARFLHHGVDRVDILDIRMTSQIELTDVPGMHIHTSVEECISAISAYRAEVERRQRITKDLKQREYSGGRWVLAIEEMSTLSDEIRRHWRNTKEKKDPAIPPALDDIAFLASIGRASRITMFVVMQYGAAKAFGGPSVRTNFAAFVLLRFRPAAWRLVVGTTPIPDSPSAPGRGWVVVGDREYLVQLVIATEEEVVELATTGANAASQAEPIGPPELPGTESMDMSIDRGVDAASPLVEASSGAWTSGGWTPEIDPSLPWWTPPPADDALDAVLGRLGIPALGELASEPHRPSASPTGPTADPHSTIPTGPPTAIPPPAPAPPERPRLQLIPDPDRIVGWDAAARLLDMEKGALIKAADRDKDGFPTGWKEKNRRVWSSRELLEWQANRPIAGQRDDGQDRPRPASSDS